MKSWYALYTKPRWEKKVHEAMLKRGLESYCPMNKVRKKWSDRYKIVEEPLFKSYLFVHIVEDEKSIVRYIDGVVNYVYWLGKPAKINAEDINRIKRFLNEHSEVVVESKNDPKPGDKVVINSGVFMEHQGTVINTNKNRVEINIESLGCKLVALVDKDSVTLKA